MHGAYYFVLPHESEYKIRLTNDNDVRCDAIVYVDGDKIGTWRINEHGRITIERPANKARKFTLLKTKSHEGIMSGMRSGKFENGLVKIIFRPEKIQERCEDCVYTNSQEQYLGKSGTNFQRECNQSYSAPMSASFMSSSMTRSGGMSEAGTGLGRASRQRFNRTSPLQDIDHENITTINARLVVE